jgi:hypothetical protein
MVGWSPQEAIAMERRHILDGEKAVALQSARVWELTAKGYYRSANTANELLDIFQELLEFSRFRLRDLESRYGEPSNENSDAVGKMAFATSAARE